MSTETMGMEMTGSDERDRLVKRFAYEYVSFNHDPGRVYLVTDITDDCMVELEGMSGLFAPELFKLASPVRDVCGHCNGSGFEVGSKTKCGSCGGDGIAISAPAPQPVAGEQWHVATMNDCIVIVNQKPHPAPVDCVNPDTPGPSLVISMGSGSREAEELARRVVEAHNAAAATVPVLVEALKAAQKIVSDRAAGGRMITTSDEASAVYDQVDAALATVQGKGDG